MPITTKQMADVASVSEQTVRNYTRWYAELLSPAARGEAGQRLFSDEDVQVFRAIADLRKRDVPQADIIEQLRRGDIFVNVAPQQTPQHEATNGPQSPQTAQISPQMLMLVRQDLQRQIDEIKRNQPLISRNDKLQGALWGAIVAFALVALFVWILWLSSNGG